VYAVGDVARWHNPRYGVEMRIEHRMNATEQALVVAKNITGDSAIHDPVPYFWTDQYDAKIQGYGTFPPGCVPKVVAGDPADRRFVARYEVEGHVTGVVAWNMPKELLAERKLLMASPLGAVRAG
jgi:NADPH-dependent 2,4-dienoyl-CoA reductase/sulfur reductase-like enzyme